jgi:hypothetical protein
MRDKGLKQEKKMYKYTDRVIRRVKTYGYGNYGDKPEAVCYWVKDKGCFVSFKKNKLRMFLTKVQWKLRYYFVIRLWEDFIKKMYHGSE